MKAVFAGKTGEKKLYYILNSDNPLTDGVLVNEDDKPEVVSFWEIVCFSIDFRKYTQSKFHEYLWSTPNDDESEKWYRIFIKKSQNIEDSMLNGVQIRSDIMKAKIKQKSLLQRADQFRTSLLTGTPYFAKQVRDTDERL
jgi:hypothetical protein